VASLAQVHRATLKDGTSVAVKFQHPEIREFSLLDMELTALLVTSIKWIFPQFQLEWLIDEMQANLPLELK
jgi:aarF domain-containing kinase